MTKYFLSKRLNLIVNQREDKTLSLTRLNGAPYENAGLLICSVGGIERFWELCINEEEYQRRIADRDFRQSPEYKAEQARKNAERSAIAAARHKAEFDALPSPIPVSYKNLGIVLRYLNDQNYGTVELPCMTVGYSYNQYDCDGHSASAVVLDSDLIENGENLGRRFCVGAPVGHLTKYMRCR